MTMFDRPALVTLSGAKSLVVSSNETRFFAALRVTMFDRPALVTLSGAKSLGVDPERDEILRCAQNDNVNLMQLSE